jgi:hypothetical protein
MWHLYLLSVTKVFKVISENSSKEKKYIYIPSSNESITFLFLGKLGCQGSTYLLSVKIGKLVCKSIRIVL